MEEGLIYVAGELHAEEDFRKGLSYLEIILKKSTFEQIRGDLETCSLVNVFRSFMEFLYELWKINVFSRSSHF